MADGMTSLLAGRNRAPLSQDEVRRAINTFLGLDATVNARHDPDSPTGFRVSKGADGVAYGEIAFGCDIYPGPGVADPNSALSLDAAAAHELTHFYRWKDKRALSEADLGHVDEALTSLEAISRYGWRLNDTDVRQLVSDAIQRLQLFVLERVERGL